MTTLGIFKNAKVLITGHTGFKGSWLAAWLVKMGAKVTGGALAPHTKPSHYNALDFSQSVLRDHRVEITKIEDIRQIVHDCQPDFVFHLAAQALVRQSYADPIATFNTNTMGTINLLEALRGTQKPCIAVIITSDKSYNNVEWVWGYRETDELGGPDPYSASKGAAELAIRSYIKSYFSGADKPVRIAVARAGNVIGGGDWAQDRIVPDCVRAWANNEIVKLRNPKATRPWQHVLEPLSGYLVLAAALAERPNLHGEAFNFGPPAHQDHTVQELVEKMACHWEQVKWQDVSENNDGPYESGLLKLNCDKAQHLLHWRAVLDFESTVQFTANWYKQFYQEPRKPIRSLTLAQIEEYSRFAKEQGMSWAL